MDKPLSLIINEATEEIVNAINKQNLHPSILLPIIKDIYTDVKYSAEIQYKKEKDEYEQSLLEENKNVKSEE